LLIAWLLIPWLILVAEHEVRLQNHRQGLAVVDGLRDVVVL